MGACIVVSRKFLPWKVAAYTRYVYRVGIGAERRGYSGTRTRIHMDTCAHNTHTHTHTHTHIQDIPSKRAHIFAMGRDDKHDV